MLRRRLLAGSVASPFVLAARPSRAEWAPKQPIHVIVGFAPGGTADIAARLAGEAIQRRAGYTVVVDGKTGALGFIALKAVANSPPDGYTVGIGIMGSLAVAPVVPGSQIPLDLDRELVPICNLVGVPMALIARPTAPYKTVAALIASAKANPGKVTYGSTGNGSTNQLGAELSAAEAGGLKLLHVPSAAARRRSPISRRGRSTSSSPTSRRSSARSRAARCARWRRVVETQSHGARPAAAHQGHPDARHQQLVWPRRTGCFAVG